ncbi:unnamed protein product [Arabis nemorensis]|uniref:Uncharacterized protein n=1 Tax=Arabis nemorensis TaxID=586526 RepID=A0A565CT92_9BRAS|nr:unnamed protein product [Arabis nemorensis]
MEKKNVLYQGALCKPKEKPEQTIVQTKAKISYALDKLVPNLSITSMMHLSLSKGVETCLTKEHTSIGEEPPEITLQRTRSKLKTQCNSWFLRN